MPAANSRWNSSSNVEDSADDGLGAVTLCHEISKRREIAVALDQRGHRSRTRDEALVELPDVVADRRVVAVDQQRTFRVEHVAGDVYLAAHLGWNGLDPLSRVEGEVVGTNGDIVDV